MNSIYLQKAKERLLLAKIAVEKQFWSGAVSNCYYALFNLMQAVVGAHNEKWKHGKLPKVFCKICYEKKFLTPEELKGFRKFVNELYELRRVADYFPNFLLDKKEDVILYLREVENVFNLLVRRKNESRTS